VVSVTLFRRNERGKGKHPLSFLSLFLRAHAGFKEGEEGREENFVLGLQLPFLYLSWSIDEAKNIL